MKCRICGKKAVNIEHCMRHAKAHQNIIEKFRLWKRALNLSWEDYLNRIAANPLTGAKAREVVEALLLESQT